MSRTLIYSEEEIKGIVYLARKIKENNLVYFADKKTLAHQKLSEVISKSNRISPSSIKRVFSFLDKPIAPVSYMTMNTLVQWYAKEVRTFKKFLEKNKEEIESDPYFSGEEFSLIMDEVNKLRKKRSPKEQEEEDWIEEPSIEKRSSEIGTNEVSISVTGAEEVIINIARVVEGNTLKTDVHVQYILSLPPTKDEKNILGTGFGRNWVLGADFSNATEAIMELIYAGVSKENQGGMGLKKILKPDRAIILDVASGTTIVIKRGTL